MKVLKSLFVLLFFISLASPVSAKESESFDNQTNINDNIVLISSQNNIDTYEVTEYNSKYIFSVDSTNMIVTINKNTYTLETYFKALEIQNSSEKDISLDKIILHFDKINDGDLLTTNSIQEETSFLLMTTLPTSGYNSYGPYFYIKKSNFSYALQQTVFGLFATLFGLTVTKSEIHIRNVLSTALSYGFISTLNETFNGVAYNRIRQATHPTVLYAMKQETQPASKVGNTYVLEGTITVTYFWTQSPY